MVRKRGNRIRGQALKELFPWVDPFEPVHRTGATLVIYLKLHSQNKNPFLTIGPDPHDFFQFLS